MADKDPLPLIRTKLHRPPVAGDHVHRPQLLDRLNKQLHRSLTLGSAPAGRTAPRL
jgi:LuxR family maltose regulon positive regulatory protein